MAIPNPILPDFSPQAITNFWAKVERKEPNECWPWKRSKFSGGYGQLKICGRSLKAHRVAYFLHYNADPRGAMVLHSCDFPPCCNPAHLFIGNALINAADCKIKGRLNTAKGTSHGSYTHPERWPRGERVGGSKLTAEQVREIRTLYGIQKMTQSQIAAIFNVKRETVGRITRGENWSHIAREGPQVSLANPRRRVKYGIESHRAKLTESQVHEIRQRYSEGDITQKQLANLFTVTEENIFAIIHRLTWKHLN